MSNRLPYALALVCSLVVSPVALSGEALLDGMAFDVKMGTKGSEGGPNTLTFHSGTFLSAVCVQHDFPQAAYSAESRDGKIVFTVESDSYTKGHMEWQGTVDGDTIEATAVWYRPDLDEPVELWARGTAK